MIPHFLFREFHSCFLFWLFSTTTYWRKKWLQLFVTHLLQLKCFMYISIVAQNPTKLYILISLKYFESPQNQTQLLVISQRCPDSFLSTIDVAFHYLTPGQTLSIYDNSFSSILKLLCIEQRDIRLIPKVVLIQHPTKSQSGHLTTHLHL